jgi:hypothetical protein
MATPVLLQPCGGTLAYSYFTGYLEVFLSNLSDSAIKNFCLEKNIDALHGEMVILVPENCKPPTRLSDYDPENIEQIGNIKIHADVSGVVGRPYAADVYKINHKGSAIYAMMSAPASLVTIYKMLHNKFLLVDECDAKVAREHFMTTLNSFLVLNSLINFKIIPVSTEVLQGGLAEKIFTALH